MKTNLAEWFKLPLKKRNEMRKASESKPITISTPEPATPKPQPATPETSATNEAECITAMESAITEIKDVRKAIAEVRDANQKRNDMNNTNTDPKTNPLYKFNAPLQQGTPNNTNKPNQITLEQIRENIKRIEHEEWVKQGSVKRDEKGRPLKATTNPFLPDSISYELDEDRWRKEVAALEKKTYTDVGLLTPAEAKAEYAKHWSNYLRLKRIGDDIAAGAYHKKHSEVMGRFMQLDPREIIP